MAQLLCSSWKVWTQSPLLSVLHWELLAMPGFNQAQTTELQFHCHPSNDLA